MKNNQIQTRANKPQKMIKKNLNSAFSSVHKHALVDSASYAGDGTPTFEIPEDKLEKDFTENLLLENMNSPSLSGSSKVSSMAADLTPSSVISSNDSEFRGSNGDETSELCSLKKHGLPEAELLADYLKQARLQMLSSTGMDPRFKNLLDALVEVTVKEFCSLPDDERDWMDDLITAKSRILFVCLLMCLIATSVILLLLQFDIGGSADYTLPPT